LSFGVFTQEKKKENEKALYLCSLEGNICCSVKTSKTNLSKNNPESTLGKRAGMGDQKRAGNETRKTGKQRETYQHIMMR
tara:strand:- start:305 stop:544 length:240 start_codon:yes stop_codon:yes gene_type:complete